MSRTFWVAVGAVGGIAAYRRGERMVRHSRMLGPLGTAQVVAASTSRFAGRTAHGLGRFSEVKARREGQLVLGSVESTGQDPAVVADLRKGGRRGSHDIGGGPGRLTAVPLVPAH